MKNFLMKNSPSNSTLALSMQRPRTLKTLVMTWRRPIRFRARITKRVDSMESVFSTAIADDVADAGSLVEARSGLVP